MMEAYLRITSCFITTVARKHGNFEYLAAYIADLANPLTDEICTLLVDILHDKVKRPSHAPYFSMVDDAKLMLTVLQTEEILERYYHTRRGKKIKQGIRKEAIKSVARRFGTSESTVKRALQSRKPAWWDEVVDECTKAAAQVDSEDSGQ
jgi:hypothetical protein